MGRIQVRVTGKERAEIEAKAQAAGLSAGGFLRAAGLGRRTPRSVPRASVEREALGKAVAELNRVGNNLNQIARALNRLEAVPMPYVREALRQHGEVLKALLRVADAGGDGG